MKDALGHPIVADREVHPAALGLRAPIAIGGHVGSAGQFHGQKATHGRDMTSSFANDYGDEGRGGPYGFEDRAAPAGLFAAETDLRACTLLAAAEGAVSAFTQIAGETWKPLRAGAPPPGPSRAWERML